MSSKTDSYLHLNKSDPFKILIDIEDLAHQVDEMNYGIHRFLSALVAQRLNKDTQDELAIEIRRLLDRGLF